MNLRDLRYLIALADLRHFGRAAAACHVSQPTLSTQIRKLEDELGTALVERAPRQVMLTPAGTDIVERARRVIAEVEQMRETARRTTDPEAGSVRLGLFPTLAPYLLPHVVPDIRARFPRLELLLVEEKTEVLLGMLRAGRLDAAVLALPLHEDWLEVDFLFEEPFVLALPASHPLAGHRQLKLAELSDQHLLLLEDGHCLRDQALEVCTLAGAGEKEGFRATSLETLRQMVAAGVGITLLPMLAVKPPVPISDNIQLLPFRNPPPTRRLAMVWRRSSAMTPFLRKLAALLRELPAELLTFSAPTTTSPVRTAVAIEKKIRGKKSDEASAPLK
ncbi:MAG TPA: DNA-binding transcriptional regulator OxyR [Arenimonas sp.]|uniref:DNA-binding transcriptional regulator OxyR n=1 Tax=Arenimonas sp. TaxID=1872635 RepID=UPI002C49752C|nr:DNA-binding transcriptional regulator OxyR [Arenimonas sp.]HMB56551.1 DNA-binding transcriptional regulator OxyR [Arenimonas sp.]